MRVFGVFALFGLLFLGGVSYAKDPFPPKPPKVPGQIRCNTRCINDMCWRTYDDGRRVKFRARPKWDPFQQRWVFDPGPC